MESLLLHGQDALRATLSPAATIWCELPALYADIGLHTGATRCSDSAISPQVQTGPTRTVTSDLLSATLAEAATQLSFAEFLERCISESAPPSPPPPIPTPPLDAATQTIPTSLSLRTFPPNSRSRSSLLDASSRQSLGGLGSTLYA